MLRFEPRPMPLVADEEIRPSEPTNGEHRVHPREAVVLVRIVN